MPSRFQQLTLSHPKTCSRYDTVLSSSVSLAMCAQSNFFVDKPRARYSSDKIASAFSRTTATDNTAIVAAESVMPLLLPRTAASTNSIKLEPSACVEPPDDLLATCISTLGVPGGRKARESLRCVLQAWGEKRTREQMEVSVSIVHLSCFDIVL